jgi:hypothetical protein
VDATGRPQIVRSTSSSRFTMDALEDKQCRACRRGKDGHRAAGYERRLFLKPDGVGNARLFQKCRGAAEESPTGISRGGYHVRETSSSSFGGQYRERSGCVLNGFVVVWRLTAQQRFGNAKSISSASYNHESRTTTTTSGRPRWRSSKGQRRFPV